MNALLTAKTLIVIGNSHDKHTIDGLTEAECWPNQAAIRLGWHVRNAGVSGDTTSMYRARIQADVFDHYPSLVSIGGPENDDDGDTTIDGAGASATEFDFASNIAKHGEGGWITVGGAETVQIESIDGSTVTLNSATPLSGTPTGGESVVIASQRNYEDMIDLCRVREVPVILFPPHYRNYSVNADTVDAEKAATANLRDIVEAAAAARPGTPTVDPYGFFSSLIRGGEQTQGNFAGHVADSNAHLNATGMINQRARPFVWTVRNLGLA